MTWGEFWTVNPEAEQRALDGDRPHRARTALARLYLDQLDDKALEAIAETAIAILDERRDPDEDSCQAGDDGCGLFYGGDKGGIHWGSHDEGQADIAPVANYGIDQRELLVGGGVAFRYD